MTGHSGFELLVAVLLTVLLYVAYSDGQSTKDDKLDKIMKTQQLLIKQLMMHQSAAELTSRTAGSSGLKNCRLYVQGSKPYHTTSFNGGKIAFMHNHDRYLDTIGIGELNVVLNGVEFRTRHNDYKLRKPKSTWRGGKIQLDELEDIKFPDVPRSVKGSVSRQVAEMLEYFKAFKNQDPKHRDYRKYFKPVLCYLEGVWTNADQNVIHEPFASDRHKLDAKSWIEMQAKDRFTAYTGRKHSSENIAFLPTKIAKVENGVPVISQWSYRVACHPIKKALPTNRLVLVDDLKSRVVYRVNSTFFGHDKVSARYKVAPLDKDYELKQELNYNSMLLDDLMAEIPGKNGYGANLKDFGMDKKLAKEFRKTTTLNAAYYHRHFSAGGDKLHRGFNDAYLFMAKNTQEYVTSQEVKQCNKYRPYEACTTLSERWSYAIPLEIIYLTPLHKWNPYNLEYKESLSSADYRLGTTRRTAFPGIGKQTYYKTPVEFYGQEKTTLYESRWVKDRSGTARHVSASGVRILTFPIKNIGKIRTRYPVMPIHQESTAAYQELDVLKDAVFMKKQWPYANLYN